MNAPDPYDMVTRAVMAIQTQNELAAARVEIARLKKELAEAQENYHQVNETVARLLKQNERLRKAGDAMLPFFIYPPYEKGSHKAVLNWNAAKEGRANG